MPVCLKCGKKFHYCSSCDPDSAANMGYCSQSCWKNSPDYERAVRNHQDFIDSLSEAQLKMYRKIMIDYQDYEHIFDNMIPD